MKCSENPEGPGREMTKQEDSARLFYALWPEDPERAEFMRLQTNLSGRLTRYGNFHITLAFLGDQPRSLLPRLQDILTRLPTGPIALTLDRLGYFNRQRIAWAGMHAPPDALSALQRSLTQLLKQEGIAFDAQPSFRPHVTLARNAEPPPDMAFEPIRWDAYQVALVESDMRGDGVVYRVRALRSLDAAARVSDESGQNLLDTGE
jgi:2'-5' RNA ligase